MFKFADLGRMWVPVDIATGEGEGEGTVRIWLLQTLYTREELVARDERVLDRAIAGLEDRKGELRTVEDVNAMVQRVTAVEESDLAELLERTHDWRDVAGEGGKPAEFSRERLAAMLAYRFIALPARAALFAASREGVRKNSQPGPGGSPGRLQA